MDAPTTRDRVVVGVDGSPTAAAALRWAAREARVHGRRLAAVLAWSYLDQRHIDVDSRFDPEYAEADALAALDAYVACALGADAPAVDLVPVCDVPASGLLQQSRDAFLLVVGSRGLGGFRGLLLGSVSDHCIHESTVPVAIVRTDTDSRRRMGTVVVGIDGSSASVAALQWALDEARAHGSSVEVVHAWRIPMADNDPFARHAFDPTLLEQAGTKLVDDALDAADTSGLETPVRRSVQPGGAAAVLLGAADHADLVVVGARDTSGVHRMLLGSVSHQVAQHAPCPVVVVPAPE